MRQEDFDKINAWMGNPENIKKLTPLEAATINLYFQQYEEKIAPIVIRAMNRDKEAHFIIKL